MITAISLSAAGKVGLVVAAGVLAAVACLASEAWMDRRRGGVRMALLVLAWVAVLALLVANVLLVAALLGRPG